MSQTASKVPGIPEGGENSWECTWDVPSDAQGQPHFNSPEEAEALGYTGEDVTFDPEESREPELLSIVGAKAIVGGARIIESDLPDDCAEAAFDEEAAVGDPIFGNPQCFELRNSFDFIF